MVKVLFKNNILSVSINNDLDKEILEKIDNVFFTENISEIIKDEMYEVLLKNYIIKSLVKSNIELKENTSYRVKFTFLENEYRYNISYLKIPTLDNGYNINKTILL